MIRILIFVATLAVQFASSQRYINMLNFAWLTNAGDFLYPANPDVATSSMLVPMAVQHFNQRYGGVLPFFSSLGSCDAQIRLVTGRIRDDQGLSSLAMKTFITLRATRRIDIIQGSIRSDVSFKSDRLINYAGTDSTNPGLHSLGSHGRDTASTADLPLCDFRYSQR
jgi:hypothetical protein